MILDNRNKIKFYILHDHKKKTSPVALSLIDFVICFYILTKAWTLGNCVKNSIVT